jgi:glycosyltransferase involved in cell wall biosynthesis
MNIVIDGRMIGWTGIGRYTRHLLDELQQLDHDNSYIVLLQKKDLDTWQPSQANFRKELADYAPYSFGEQLGLCIKLYSLHADLVHFPSFNGPVFYLGHRMFTIADLTLLRHETARGGGLIKLIYRVKNLAMRFVFRDAVMRSQALLTYTEYVKKDILNHYKNSIFRGRLNKITPIHLAVDNLASVKASQPDIMKGGKPFLLYAGNYYPSKNIGRLLEALVEVRKNKPDLELVLIGKEDHFQKQLQQQAEQLGLGGAVVFTGFVPDSQLVWYYQHTALFVFPSLSEGFGLTPLEAMAAGTPVISSDASCMPEVLGRAAAYFDPKDPGDMATKIESLLDSSAELGRLRKAGLEQVKKYSWHKMAEETLSIYKKVLKR